MRIIDVRPVAGGWTVRSERLGDDLVYRGGLAAEQAALRLADLLANLGIPSEIRMYLREGPLGSRFFRPVLGPIHKAPDRDGGVS